MAKKQPKTEQITPRESEAELMRRHERTMLLWKETGSFAKTAIIGCCVVGFAYVTFYLPIAASAGKETVINQSVLFLANIKAHVLISWGAALAGTIYGLNERRLRHKEREEKDTRIRKLETKIDPGVTSSGLSVSGTTSTADSQVRAPA